MKFDKETVTRRFQAASADALLAVKASASPDPEERLQAKFDLIEMGEALVSLCGLIHRELTVDEFAEVINAAPALVDEVRGGMTNRPLRSGDLLAVYRLDETKHHRQQSDSEDVNPHQQPRSWAIQCAMRHQLTTDPRFSDIAEEALNEVCGKNYFPGERQAMTVLQRCGVKGGGA